MTNVKVIGDYVHFLTNDGSCRQIRVGAINTLNWKKGVGRPKKSDYVINDLTAKERTTLNKIVKKEKENKKIQKSVKFIDKFNAYIWTLVIGLYMLAVLTESASKIRI